MRLPGARFTFLGGLLLHEAHGVGEKSMGVDSMRHKAAITTFAGAMIAASLIVAPTAEAKTIFYQNWRGSAKERSSRDFVPRRTKIKIGGHCNRGGSARYFYTQLKRTNGGKKIFSSYSFPCTGSSYMDNRWVGVRRGTSYYLKWFGQKKDGKNGYKSPGQGVFAAY